MFLAKYSIHEHYINFRNCMILRFSKNAFADINIIFESDNIENILKECKNLASINEEQCYNTIYPWNDIEDNGILNDNSEVIIVYNKNGYIQGWCNIKYEQINDDDGKIYTCFIDKIVVRSIPKINRIGSLIIDFIKKECISKDINFKDVNTNMNKLQVDVLYLYSLPTSIDFYNDNPHTLEYSYKSEIFSAKDVNILSLVFIIFPNNILDDQIKLYRLLRSKQWINFGILHTFEVNSEMDDKTIQDYREFKPDSEICTIKHTIPVIIQECIKKNNINIYMPYLLSSKRTSFITAEQKALRPRQFIKKKPKV